MWVMDNKDFLYSQEEVWELDRQEIARKASEKRDTLYGELLKKLEPLGRIGDLIAATVDKTKLSALAHEFGLEI